jgi:hypothetical protein
MKPAIERKQRAGRRLARWLVPDTRLRQVVNDVLTRMIAWPIVWRLSRRALAPEGLGSLTTAGS